MAGPPALITVRFKTRFNKGRASGSQQKSRATHHYFKASSSSFKLSGSRAARQTPASTFCFPTYNLTRIQANTRSDHGPTVPVPARPGHRTRRCVGPGRTRNNFCPHGWQLYPTAGSESASPSRDHDMTWSKIRPSTSSLLCCAQHPTYAVAAAPPAIWKNDTLPNPELYLRSDDSDYVG